MSLYKRLSDSYLALVTMVHICGVKISEASFKKCIDHFLKLPDIYAL